MIRLPIIFLILLNVCLVRLSAQEVVTGLQSDYRIASSKVKQERSKGIVAIDTIDLPFFEDFSGHSIYPDSTKWIDDFVFINNTYSDKQITIGIATLDAIDNSGRLYEEATSAGFKADELTSQPVNLNYTPLDNVWFSFFYQAGGLSDMPELNDSLTLQFLAPEENKWYSVWKADPPDSNNFFRPVMIKVDQPAFLKQGFRFRFINYATLSANSSDPSMVGNSDIWNIDYILLDRNRNEGDTIFSDVAFRLPLRSVLNTHEAMPWKQFRQVFLQEMSSVIPVHYRNNDTIVRNVTRDFEILDVYQNTLSHSFSAGATNIDPLSNVSYDANLIYTFNTSNEDSALFRIKAFLKTDEFDPKENDTLVYFQNFSNYFAFDDGSSEGGYGINGLGSRNAMAAYRFTSYLQDTIRAIKICFNDSYQNTNKRSFDLMIWDDNNGVPGNVLFTREEVMVEQGEFINGFYTYLIPEGVLVNNNFYVGWKQRSETFLNAGFDVNTPHAGKQLYWINGLWQESQVLGSIMIRPVLGEPLRITGIKDVIKDSIKKNLNQIKIWPNPAHDYIRIDGSDIQLKESVFIRIIDLNGHELIKVPFREQIDISSLHEGIFTVVIIIDGIPSAWSRLIKIR